jgi:NAD+ kinase
MDHTTVSFTSSERIEDAKRAEETMRKRYGHVAPEEADVVVALGGDGFMLQTLHRFMTLGKPIFGLNLGSVGFLMNEFRTEGLIERLQRAHPINLDLLQMTALDVAGVEHRALAINEVSLLRQTRLAAKIRVLIDGVVRMDQMICDGVLVSTPAGSTAYNNAVHGPILPLGCEVLALTPISSFRPRRWRGALLPQNARVSFENCSPTHRPVSAVADFTEVRDIVQVDIRRELGPGPTLLFDPENSLAERIIKEQFLP